MSTATVKQLIDRLSMLDPNALLVMHDEDTGWLMEIDPDDFIAPNRAPDDSIILRSVGYFHIVGETRGETP